MSGKRMFLQPAVLFIPFYRQDPDEGCIYIRDMQFASRCFSNYIAVFILTAFNI